MEGTSSRWEAPSPDKGPSAKIRCPDPDRRSHLAEHVELEPTGPGACRLKSTGCQGMDGAETKTGGLGTGRDGAGV